MEISMDKNNISFREFFWEPKTDSDLSTTQTNILAGPREVLSIAMINARTKKQTKVFSDLCDPDILQEWNEFQANPCIIIIKEKDLPSPARTAKVVAPIIVDYVELDIELFAALTLIGAFESKFSLESFIDALPNCRITELIVKMLDLGVEAELAVMNALMIGDGFGKISIKRLQEGKIELFIDKLGFHVDNQARLLVETKEENAAKKKGK